MKVGKPALQQATGAVGGVPEVGLPDAVDPRGSAELQVPVVTADPAVASARGLHGRSDLDRHADAVATLAGFVRRAFIQGAR